MNSTEAAQQAWDSPLKAFQWLVSSFFQPQCKNGHFWIPHATRQQPRMHCKASKKCFETIKMMKNLKKCDPIAIARKPGAKGSFQHTLPCALSVEQLVKGLCGFAPKTPLTTVQKEIGLTLKSLRELYYQIRLVMFSAALPKLGGLRRIVVVDETYFTRRKRCKGGLGGRVTWGMKVSLLGMVELDMNTRKETGNIRLTIIP